MSAGRRPVWDGRLALETAQTLKTGLAAHGISSDVHDGYGLALVSVWVGLVVWCNGDRFWWRTGWNPQNRRIVYAWHPALDPDRAARRIAFRYAQMRRLHRVPWLETDTRRDHGPR
ncbi:hypothetical protein [Sphaerisporangium sp. TRM90804]|uniref:hypothetical protein n=1 Tax=Sphaerisporangium sp. TRM90804 TaxID=3031113 RepID=UPI00244C4D7A|nr:hypothetical protein [Sphaerisporangium sp. TRM90804]MDH2429278.1 hypothetical protein [Sphaerisporangium sp. TRM90804]